MKYIQTKLKNGGKLNYAKNKVNKATYVDVVFNGGAYVDTIPGLAHFVEHMLFSGTKFLSREEVFKKYSSFMGTNAITHLRGITFTGTIFTNELADYLSTIASMILDSPFTQQSVDKERKVINQEIIEYADKHESISYDNNLYNLFALPVYKIPTVAGTVQSISKITHKDIVNFVKKYFVANNLEIYIVSPASMKKIKSIANRTLSNVLPVNEKLGKYEVEFLKVKNDNFIKTKQVDIPKCYIYLNFTFPKDRLDHVFARKMRSALSIVNDSATGLLNSLRLKKDLVYSCYVSYKRFEDKSGLTVSCNCEKENVNEVVRTAAEYFQEIFKNGFTEEQLQKIKRLRKHSETIKVPDVYPILGNLYDFKWYGKVLDYKKLDKIAKNITVQECNDVIREALSHSKPSLSLYGSFDKSTLISRAELNKLFDFKAN